MSHPLQIEVRSVLAANRDKMRQRLADHGIRRTQIRGGCRAAARMRASIRDADR